MNITKNIALAVLTACALALPALGEKKHPVERPFHVEATVTWTINLADGSATGYHKGVATHGGRFISDASAVWDVQNFRIVSATGTATTANGDKLFWKITPDQPGVVQYTGGTGRFEGATGAWLTTSVTILESEVNPPTMTVTLSYTGVGALTY